MQTGAATELRDVEAAHIASILKPPAPPSHAEPASLKAHAAAVSSQPDESSPVVASAAAAPKPVPYPFASTRPDTPQPAPTRDSELEAAVLKLSEELVIKCACCRVCLRDFSSQCVQVRGKQRTRQADAARSRWTRHLLHAASFVHQSIWRLRGRLQHVMAVA